MLNEGTNKIRMASRNLSVAPEYMDAEWQPPLTVMNDRRICIASSSRATTMGKMVSQNTDNTDKDVTLANEDSNLLLRRPEMLIAVVLSCHNSSEKSWTYNSYDDGEYTMRAHLV